MTLPRRRGRPFPVRAVVDPAGRVVDPRPGGRWTPVQGDADIRRTAAAVQLSVGLLKRRARETARDRELSGPEAAVLSRLDRNGPDTTAALARWEQITPQAMGATVAALEARELIARAPDPEDGRRSILTLTGPASVCCAPGATR